MSRLILIVAVSFVAACGSSDVGKEGQVVGTLGSYGKIPGRLDFVHHIAVDSTGAIYVAEIKNWRVQKFAAKK